MPARSSSSVRVFYPRWTRESLVQHLRERLPKLAGQLPLARVVLFGSYASGRSTVASDIDLLIIYRGPRRENAYSLVRKTLDIPGLEPHIYSLEEAGTVKRIIQRMERGGVVLLGEG